jgi:hypothetical protein
MNKSSSSSKTNSASAGSPSGDPCIKLSELLHKPFLLTEEGSVERKNMGTERSHNCKVEIAYSPSAIKMMRSVYQPGMTYRFRTTKAATIISSASGAVQLATPVYPSSMAEYTSLAGIFDECRLRSTVVRFGFYSNGTTPVVTPIAVSFDPSNVSTAPTFGVAASIPGVKIFNIFQTAGSYVCKWRKVGPPRPWSLISASGTGTDPVGGVIGTWYFSTAAASTFSASIATYVIECDYEFRNPT